MSKRQLRCNARCYKPDGHTGDHEWEDRRVGRPGFDLDTEHTYVEREAKRTAQLAAWQAMPRTGTQRRRVLGFINRRGRYGATDEEIQHKLGMHHNSQTPRRKELEEGDWIIDSGKTRPTDSGAEAVVWVMSENGLRKWKELDE